jgi:GntR family transcriptional repressor for pyruvate dehydrogenase complex
MRKLEPVERTTITEQVIQSLIDLIVEGELKPGDKLPSEQQLLDQLQVGRTSLREAMRTLSLVGLLEPRRGSGTYVTHSFSDFLADQLEWSALLGERDLLELIEVRRPLEVQAAALAAQRASEQDIQQLNETLERLAESSKGDLEERTEADLMFHMGLVEATGNRILCRLMLSLNNLLRRYIGATVDEPLEATLRQHRAVLEGVQARDPAQAAEAMDHHINVSHEGFLAVWAKPHRRGE